MDIQQVLVIEFWLGSKIQQVQMEFMLLREEHGQGLLICH
jgi:hypothetical protein